MVSLVEKEHKNLWWRKILHSWLDMTTSWEYTYLPAMHSQYKLEEIADKFELFFQQFSMKSLHLKGKLGTEGEHSKVR